MFKDGATQVDACCSSSCNFQVFCVYQDPAGIQGMQGHRLHRDMAARTYPGRKRDPRWLSDLSETSGAAVSRKEGVYWGITAKEPRHKTVDVCIAVSDSEPLHNN